MFVTAVDVRDAATMMVAVFETLEAGGQRLLVAPHFDLQSAADVAREEPSEL